MEGKQVNSREFQGGKWTFSNRLKKSTFFCLTKKRERVKRRGDKKVAVETFAADLNSEGWGGKGMEMYSDDKHRDFLDLVEK